MAFGQTDSFAAALAMHFNTLKAGRIHFECTRCPKRVSNQAREANDPAEAVLVIGPCRYCAKKNFGIDSVRHDCDFVNIKGEKVHGL